MSQPATLASSNAPLSHPQRLSAAIFSQVRQSSKSSAAWPALARRQECSTLQREVRRMPAPSMKPDPSSQTGRRFGDYRVVRLLARGGMGRVYEAEHVPSGRVVALKLPDVSTSNDATAMRRFRSEGQLLDSVRHPNIVRVFEVGFEDDCPFIVMELLRGETLRARVERTGPVVVRRGGGAVHSHLRRGRRAARRRHRSSRSEAVQHHVDGANRRCRADDPGLRNLERSRGRQEPRACN